MQESIKDVLVFFIIMVPLFWVVLKLVRLIGNWIERNIYIKKASKAFDNALDIGVDVFGFIFRYGILGIIIFAIIVLIVAIFKWAFAFVF